MIDEASKYDYVSPNQNTAPMISRVATGASYG